jgi:hypothetical protein
MLKTIEGVYHNGRIELAEEPESVEGARVLVTFLPVPRTVDLRERGIDEKQAADLRWRLQSFADDWDDPGMAVYDVP